MDGLQQEQVFRDLPVGWALHDGRVLLAVNAAAAVLLGYDDPADLVGQPVFSVVHPDSRAVARERAAAVLRTGQGVRAAAERFLTRRGDDLWFETVASPATWCGRPVVQVLAWDVTARVRTESRLAHEATHDRLTGLPARVLLEEHWSLLHARASRNGMLPEALFCDVDDFKLVNDTLGHDVGDQVLQQLGGRLSSVAREGETVGRYGGDEFVVLLEGSDDQAHLALAERVRAALAPPMWIGSHRVTIRASLGGAVARYDHEPLGDVLRRADAEMYRAKRGRRLIVLPEPAAEPCDASRSEDVGRLG